MKTAFALGEIPHVPLIPLTILERNILMSSDGAKFHFDTMSDRISSSFKAMYKHYHQLLEVYVQVAYS